MNTYDISPEEIREVRFKLNLSQDDIAELIGVSRISIHRWETGKTKPSKFLLKQLKNLFSTVYEKKTTEPLRKRSPYLTIEEAKRKLELEMPSNYDWTCDPFYNIKSHELDIDDDLSKKPDNYLC
jgi:DNA-binding XRE family transcriptional regulator